MARLFNTMTVGGQKLGFYFFSKFPGSAMSRLFVPGSEQPRLELGRSSIGTDGLGWLTSGRDFGRVLGVGAGQLCLTGPVPCRLVSVEIGKDGRSPLIGKENGRSRLVRRFVRCC